MFYVEILADKTLNSLTAITYKDVGYEDNAGAINFPWLFETYRPPLDIKRPPGGGLIWIVFNPLFLE